MIRHQWLAAASLLGLLAAAPASAVDNGFYLGGSVGGASVEITEDNLKFDESDFAWKIYGGYQLAQFLALEAAYRDFGKPDGTVQGFPVEVDPSGFDVSVLAGLPLGPVYVFGKVGALFWDADVNFDGDTGSDDGTDVGVGIGASIDLARVRLRGEIEYFDVEDGVYMYTVGGAWLF